MTPRAVQTILSISFLPCLLAYLSTTALSSGLVGFSHFTPIHISMSETSLAPKSILWYCPAQYGEVNSGIPREHGVASWRASRGLCIKLYPAERLLTVCGMAFKLFSCIGNCSTIPYQGARSAVPFLTSRVQPE